MTERGRGSNPPATADTRPVEDIVELVYRRLQGDIPPYNPERSAEDYGPAPAYAPGNAGN
jgi:hypothetical protein